MAVPKRKTPRAKTRQRRASNWTLDRAPNLGTLFERARLKG